MTKQEFSALMQTIPHQPGCYKYYDLEKTLLYVGKAKDLRKRVSSYFNKTVDNYKTRKLVSLIHSIDFTVTDSEHDAFLLENSLIKHYQPRFNIDLKDDKTYPYIVIKKEPFPRVFLTRRLIRDGSEYLGPFTGVFRVKELLDIVKQNIPLRTCSLNLTPANIAKGKFKVCLEYHLGNCKGPCEGLQTLDDYNEKLQHVRHVMKGNIGDVIKALKVEMNGYAADMKFEKAQMMKLKIESLLNYQSKSIIVNPHLNNADIACILSDDNYFYVNYMMLSQGSIIHTKTLQIEKKVDELEEDVLSLALDNLRDTFQSNAKEVIVPIMVNVTDPNVKVTIPKAGDKKQLLDLGIKNAEIFLQEMRRKDALMLTQATKDQTLNVLAEMQESLQLTELPLHIECFDNSNFQGSYPVAAMVCFKEGVPSKKDYRHFHIKTVEGINDFASMSEIVYRRYKKLSEDNQPLPQLVIIDGGKGQLGAAMESIERLGLIGRMAIVGLAKREESIFFPGDSEPLQLPYDNPAHLLIRRIRDEVHRFGITFHRQVRSKGTIKNDLEGIPGIGEKTATDLLKEFRSVKNIKTITERELTRVIGASKASIVWSYFHEDDQPKEGTDEVIE
ncbi:excinuclease ABC subunit C [Flavipsychrobacter stenotrophus]|uniref:UvrABC system protein C n=1 Tax=Flavipsychrobacter stenotrophus TaxID=2077091 RepID=A0A2S7SPA3_9BACT|nr:excinuclease ABC subunit UvrC [Flavipsychrobacter stenotrophus]PQJ08720.1 excinuclease ABC subunit C [Flavipsychrobacter stenotrophus]